MVPCVVCLVEDDPGLAELLADYLKRQSFTVVHVADGSSAVERILSDEPDLVLLDVMLPGLDGFEVCRRVRPRFRGPILMLTARVDDVDEIVGLEVGADDYVKKPVEPRVLLARMRALLRRTLAADAFDETKPRKLEFGRVVIDASRHEARVDGRDVELTTAEFDLLWVLASRAGTPVSREALHLELRGVEYDGIDRSIDLRVSRLRKKLGDEGPGRIRSIRGVGYLWAEDP